MAPISVKIWKFKKRSSEISTTWTKKKTSMKKRKMKTLMITALLEWVQGVAKVETTRAEVLSSPKERLLLRNMNLPILMKAKEPRVMKERRELSFQNPMLRVKGMEIPEIPKVETAKEAVDAIVADAVEAVSAAVTARVVKVGKAGKVANKIWLQAREKTFLKISISKFLNKLKCSPIVLLWLSSRWKAQWPKAQTIRIVPKPLKSVERLEQIVVAANRAQAVLSSASSVLGIARSSQSRQLARFAPKSIFKIC
jgi:hypothetical protein